MIKPFKRKLRDYVADNPDLRWKGFYKVKYKGKWTIAEWCYLPSGWWYWLLADGTIFYGDNDFDCIIEKRIKEF